MSTGIFPINPTKSGVASRVDKFADYTYAQTHGMSEAASVALISDSSNPFVFADNSLYTGAPFGNYWYLRRGMLSFNCLTLPAAASISGVKVHIYARANREGSVDQSDVHIVEGVFSDPIVVADYAAQRASVASGGVLPYPIDVPGYRSFILNSTGRGWITKEGNTLLGIRLQGDINVLEPDDPPSRNDLDIYYITAPGSLQATPVVEGTNVLLSAYNYHYGVPTLEVEYTGADSPTYPRVRFTYYIYGVEEEWLHKTDWQTGKGIGVTFTANLVGLEPETTYHSRVETQITEGGAIWRLDREIFVTGTGYSTVTTQANTDTIAEQSTGWGIITDKGDSEVTQHGHVWSTSSGPTTADSKTENGAKPNLGQFNSLMTGLIPSTLYYIKAYATNTQGTGYGDEVQITTLGTVGRREWWVEDTAFHYFDQFGVERKAEGTTGKGIPLEDILTHLL